MYSDRVEGGTIVVAEGRARTSLRGRGGVMRGSAGRGGSRSSARPPQRMLIQKIVNPRGGGPVRRVVRLQRSSPYGGGGVGGRGAGLGGGRGTRGGRGGRGRSAFRDENRGNPDAMWTHDKFEEMDEYGEDEVVVDEGGLGYGDEDEWVEVEEVEPVRKTPARRGGGGGAPGRANRQALTRPSRGGGSAAQSSSRGGGGQTAEASGRWGHDMYEQRETGASSRLSRREKQAERAAALNTSSSSRRGQAMITIENLAADIKRNHVQELCSRFGDCQVSWFASGDGGIAEVTFNDREIALTAAREIDGNELDNDGHILEAYLGPRRKATNDDDVGGGGGAHEVRGRGRDTLRR